MNRMSSKNYHKAFSLIELSFVILIIGVLVAGIVLGKNLMEGLG